EDGLGDFHVTGVQTCALPIWPDREFSLVFEYRGETQLAAWSLENAVTVFDPDVGEGEAVQFSLAAHDFVHRRGVLGETLASDPRSEERRVGEASTAGLGDERA